MGPLPLPPTPTLHLQEGAGILGVLDPRPRVCVVSILPHWARASPSLLTEELGRGPALLTWGVGTLLTPSTHSCPRTLARGHRRLQGSLAG